MHTLILGAGYSGIRIAQHAQALGTVCGTRRTHEGVEELQSSGIQGCVVNGALSVSFSKELKQVTHLVVGVAPGREPPLNDPMLQLLHTMAHSELPLLQWVGYLSTIGVYGNYDGHWVDEGSQCKSTQARSLMRREAELAWQDFAKQRNIPVSILRLAGIYGPGRNPVEKALSGNVRMLIKPTQVFNRIHVDDLAVAVVKAAQLNYQGILNITDDYPAPVQDVIRFAHKLIGKDEPEEINFDTAQISPMARSFYAENKRVSNAVSKKELGIDYQYPSYKQALTLIYEAILNDNP